MHSIKCICDDEQHITLFSANVEQRKKNSLDSLRTLPLVLHNFLHSVNSSTGRKKITNENPESFNSCWWEISSRSHFVHILAQLGRVSGENSQHFSGFYAKRGNFLCYGKTNFGVSIDAQLLRWKIDATLSEPSSCFPFTRSTFTHTTELLCKLRCKCFDCKLLLMMYRMHFHVLKENSNVFRKIS